ncbi:exonuclease domain-containing protein [Devosia ginsengisoli]|uniref:3'-5' exonuclease n=1 Tax=Devosia ginsengisoli TaxID=400770 RepID=UPI0026F209DE|nr:exonuclease domain-containing protein [Devosia ginsengisoli]MCR6673288.1 exonuclease domain-containing protein [Devosia ginsengisoli]
MGAEASAVNGLTTEFLAEHGVPVAEVLAAYEEAIAAGYIIVAFNAQFDTKVMRAELRRAGRPDLFEQTPNICVMRPLTDILKLPSRRGPAWGYKWPNLAEACAHFGIVNENAHDAMGDAVAAMEILRALHASGQLPEPAIHFAKERV